MNQEQPQTLVDHGVVVTETMTTPSRPGKKPRPVWVITGNVYGLETFFREIGGRKFRGNWSFFENPSDKILRELSANGRESFADQMESTIARKEKRISRYEDYSENAVERSEEAFRRVNAISSMIPMGQPILVGHHSEGRHRRDIKRMDNGMRKGVEESKKSEYYEWKARSLAHDISSRKSSRQYLQNRISEVTKELSELRRWEAEDLGKKNRHDLAQRLAQVEEKLAYWKSQMQELEVRIIAEGGMIASPESVKPGMEVCYRGTWYPAVRVNRKSVTIGNWLGIATFTFKVEYAGISKYRVPKEHQ